MAETTLIGLMGQQLFGKCPLHDWRDGYFSIQYLVEHDLFRGALAPVVNFLGSQAATPLQVEPNFGPSTLILDAIVCKTNYR